MKKLLIFLLLFTVKASSQVAPVLYYTFDTTNPYAPAVGTGNFTVGGSTITAGAVGNCESQLAKGGKTVLIGGSVTSANAITLQLLMKGGYNFLNNRKATLFSWGNVVVTFGTPAGLFRYNNLSFSYKSTGTTSTETLLFDLTGVDRKTLSFYNDEQWHHLAFVFNPQGGYSQIFVDGILTATGSSVTGFVSTSTAPLVLNVNTLYDQFYGSLDEIAVYNQALAPAQIYKNYLDFQAGEHYTTALYSGTIPSLPNLTAPIDTLEYPIGYVPGSTSNTIPTAALDQISEFPFPRYFKPTTLHPLFNWCNPMYVGGRFQTDVTNAVENSGAIQYELWKNYNYSLITSSNVSATTVTDYTDTTKFSGKWIAMAKQDTSLPISAITFWISAPGQTITSKTLSNSYYLQNSSGQFLNSAGAVTTTVGSKVLRPTANRCPMCNDGVGLKSRMTSLKNALSPATLDYINENDEVMPILDSIPLALDPSVVNNYDSSAFGSYREYYGAIQKTWTWAYRDTFMSVLPAYTKFSMYRIDGQDGSNGRNYFGVNYSQRRLIQSKFGGRYLGTFDYYPRYPWNWRIGVSADRGLLYLQEAMYGQQLVGDKVMSPFISPGWDDNEELNLRPGRWLGLLKTLNVWGSDFFYTAYFNLGNYTPPNPPPSNPRGYIWQLITPAYAQAVASRFDTILWTGEFPSDVPSDYTRPTYPGYQLWSGDPRVFTVARQDSLNNDRYIITTSIQPSSNQAGNAPLTKNAKFLIGTDTIIVPSRRQGSTYEYYASNQKLRQLDAWHEYTHPQRWSDDNVIEAEVPDSTDANWASSGVVETASKKDFTNSVAYVTSDTTYYYFRNRNTGNFYIWVKARVSSGSSGIIGFNTTGVAYTKNISVTTGFFAWYRFDTGADTLQITYPATTTICRVRLQIPANVQVDQFVFTQSTQSFSPVAPACSLTVSSSQVNVLCNAGTTGSITAIPSGGTTPYTYLWSSIPAQTSITASSLASGAYTVTVTDANGCTGEEEATLTQATAISITPTPVDATCGLSNGSATTSVSGGTGTYTYLWSSGETISSITAKAAANYTLTVTDASGCTKQAFVVIGNAAAGTATISSQTNVLCNGNSTGAATITMSGGTRPYTFLWSSGETDSLITGKAAGTYILTATDASGCVTPKVVTITQPLALAASINGTNVGCNGAATGGCVVAVSGGTAPYTYLWSNAATTATISNLSAGTYTVTITDANSCTAVRTKLVTQPTALSVSFTNTCSSSLAVPAGGTTPYTYLWSTAATTASVTSLTAATYTVTVTDNNGCLVSGSTTITTCDTVCTAPDTLYADNIQTAMFRITYSAGGAATSYRIYVEDLVSGKIKYTPVDAKFRRVLIQKLVAGRTYKVKVQSKCNGLETESGWSMIIYVTTKL